MKIRELTSALFALCILLTLSSFGQDLTRHWLIGAGTNAGNYKQLSHWGAKEADIIDLPNAGLNLKVNHFWGVNKVFYLGTGMDFMMMSHRLKPSLLHKGVEVFDKAKVKTKQFGAEVPLYFKWNILRDVKPIDFAVAMGHKLSYFYGNPSLKNIHTDNNFRFHFDQSYKAIEEITAGINYALFAEFYLIKKKKEGRQFVLSLNYTHYFEHAAFGKYEFFDRNNRQLAIGQLQGYCNYVILNFCYMFDKDRKKNSKP